MTAKPVPPAHPVFICYRGEDARADADNLERWLNATFGARTAFRDNTGIEWGKPWPDELRAAITRAKVVLVLIGPNWLVTDEWNRRRIDREDDWVRIEIATALELDKDVCPIRLHGARMPPPEAGLHASIARLSSLQSPEFAVDTWASFLEKLAQRLERHLGAPRSATAPEIASHDPLVPYRVHLRGRHQNLISFPGISDAVLEKTYVELRLDALDRKRAAADGRRDAELLAAHPRASSTLHELLDGTCALPGDATGLVVLGEPGAGKSTQLRCLAWKLAGDDAPHAPLPVYVPLASMAGSAQAPFPIAEAELAATAGAEQAHGLARELARLAGPNGEHGRVWLLLDGLDEVAPAQMQALRASLLALPGLYPRARIVISAREVGYDPLGPLFAHAYLRPLDPESQQALLTKLLGGEGATLWARLQKRPALARLAGNPLMLTLLAWLARERRKSGEPGAPLDLPANRALLFQSALDQLLEKPYSREQLVMSAPADVRFVLRKLALALQESPSAAWTRDELVQALRELRAEVQAVFDDNRAEWGTRESFLDQLAKRTGILAPHDGPGAPWRFLHRQFRELLAAEELHAGEVQRPRRSWRGRVGTLDAQTIPRWSEALGLYCALAKQPFDVLKSMRSAHIGATVRALPLVDGVPVAQLWDFLWRTPWQIEPVPEPWLSQHYWDGDDLRALVVRWRDEGQATEDELAELLWSKVDAKLPLVRLAWIHFALSALGPVSRKRFFEQCGRRLAKDVRADFVRIQAGEFVMGSPESEQERTDAESPPHSVRVQEFWLSRAAVTNAEYAAFDREHEPHEWKDVDAAELARHPVVNVSWWGAYLYCRWLGDDVRLPSEAEWEYACRAGTTTAFSFGVNVTPAQVNYDGRVPYAGGKKGDFRKRTVPVGSLPPNAWDLCEMHGNVWEWCTDTWHDDYELAPVDGSAWIDGGSPFRAVRGGSWGDVAERCRSAYRNGIRPGGRDDDVGFRPASSSPSDFTTSPLVSASARREPKKRAPAGTVKRKS